MEVLVTSQKNFTIVRRLSQASTYSIGRSHVCLMMYLKALVDQNGDPQHRDSGIWPVRTSRQNSRRYAVGHLMNLPISRFGFWEFAVFVHHL